MKKIFSCSVLILISFFCFAQTQYEMNEAELNKLHIAETELDLVYQKILNEYKEDTAFVKNLKVSQKIWSQYKEAELKMMYPDREPGYYGSVHPMCIAIYRTELTNERIEELQLWLEGCEEGDVCGSSVRVKR